MQRVPQKRESLQVVNRGLMIVALVSALVYLAAVTAGAIKPENRLGWVEAVILIAILVFGSGVLSRLARLAFSDKGLEIQMEELQQRVEKDVLGFLMRNLLGKAERGHLWGLAADKAFPYTKTPYFEKELRNLRDLGLIAPIRSDVSVGGLPGSGELRQFFAITAAGREYLDYWKAFGHSEERK